MSSSVASHKCPCSSCGVNLEFPAELAGTTLACPQCKADTFLLAPQDPLPAGHGAGSHMPSVDEVVSAFRGNLERRPVSFLYQAGLFLVTIAIVILPALYVALIAAAAYGVYHWAVWGTFLLHSSGFGFRLHLVKIFAYITPLLAGATIVFFMVKPFFARRVKGPQPLALNPESEPLIFAFIGQICKAVGAPFPARIDVDCELNASASLRRGFKSMFGHDLVLTLGLPLLAGMTATQIAGIVAHEFGHFTQGFAMRLTYIIYRVHRWFAIVIYERDQWDVMLEESAQNSEDWRLGILIATAQLGVWLSRSILKLLMLAGAVISSFVSRQMEYDADRYYIDLVGSQCFEENTARLATLGVSMETAYGHINKAWKASKVLPENLPAFMLLHDERMSAHARAAIADRVGLEESGIFSSHPADGDRIKQARRAGQPGLFALDIPASRLFSNFETLSKQVTFVHYEDSLNMPRSLIRLQPEHHFFENKTKEEVSPPPSNEAAEAFASKLGPCKLKLDNQSPG